MSCPLAALRHQAGRRLLFRQLKRVLALNEPKYHHRWPPFTGHDPLLADLHATGLAFPKRLYPRHHLGGG